MKGRRSSGVGSGASGITSIPNKAAYFASDRGGDSLVRRHRRRTTGGQTTDAREANAYSEHPVMIRGGGLRAAPSPLPTLRSKTRLWTAPDPNADRAH
jgi:hypothetical protein